MYWSVLKGRILMTDLLIKNKGKICALSSAFLYGLAPVLAKITYKGGANGITLTFLRASMMLPLLFFILITKKKLTSITSDKILKILILGVVGGTVPIILLYLSYDYISAGLATTLHFIYPLIIVFASAFIYKERISVTKLFSLMVVTIGILMFVEIRDASDKVGIILALLSGVFYSFYVIYLDKSGLDGMDYLTLTFYIMLTMSASSLVFGLFLKQIDFNITPFAWVFSAVISLIITVFATPLFQAGVKYEGASSAGILSTFEPITTTLLGALFLGEHIVIFQAIGIILILLGIAFSHK